MLNGTTAIIYSAVQADLTDIAGTELSLAIGGSHASGAIQANRHCSQIRTIAMFYLLSK